VLYPGRPLFVFIHSDGADAFRFKAETFWRFAPGVYFALERFAVKRARRSVVMSQAAVSRLQNHGSSVVLGRNWFDPSTFYGSGIQPPDSVPEIGWAGRLEPPKDPRKAVQVFAHLRQMGVSFRGWMAGSGTLVEDVRRDIDEAGLTDTVRMLGPLSPNELGDRLRQSSVFLMTSLWEGIPRVAIEALACGVPVVAPDVGEMHSLVSDGVNGFVSSNGDALDLAELVVDALSLDVGGEIAETVSDLDARRSVNELFAEIARHTAPGSSLSAAAALDACK
jgi:glycosyltransferase involved in cell wall biosynthesis